MGKNEFLSLLILSRNSFLLNWENKNYKIWILPSHILFQYSILQLIDVSMMQDSQNKTNKHA